jgi:hypothetical protein
MKNAAINLSICLSDIPKEKIKVSEKNGKKYLNISIAGKKEKDQFGNDVYAFVSQTKEEREAKADKSYIGDGTYIEFTNAVKQVEQMETSQNNDDLPF